MLVAGSDARAAGSARRRGWGRVAAADPHQPWEAGGDRWEGGDGRRMGVVLQPCDRPSADWVDLDSSDSSKGAGPRALPPLQT